MKILLADDNRDYLRLMKELLYLHGHDILVAEDGWQARELLEYDRFDVIISDVYMPGLDGILFHGYVRKHASNPSIPFIFISGYDDPYTMKALEDPGIDFFISKKAPVSEIIDTLKKVESMCNSGQRGGVSSRLQ